MWTHSERASVVLLGWLGTIAMLSSCSGAAPTELDEDQVSAVQTSGGRVSVCHRSTNTGVIIDIPQSALASHLRHGDYVTNLVVSHKSDQPDDGAHFRRIGDALAAARTGRLARGELRSAACRITITIAAGRFRGTDLASTHRSLERFPMVVDVPDITLRGALVMRLDARGRATAAGVGPFATTLSPVEPLSFPDGISTPIIIANAHPGGSAGNGLRVEGFVFQSGNDGVTATGGQAVFAMRAKGLVIRGNRVEAGFSESFDLRETSAIVDQNHLSGPGGSCDICLAGPGVYRVTGNRLLGGGIPGILTVPAMNLAIPSAVEPSDLPFASTLSAEISNNEVRDHRRVPVGVGIRVGAVGPGAPDVHGKSHVTIRDNLLVNNNFAIIIEAAFPMPETELKSDVDVTLGGNVMRRSCQANLLVALTRHTAALGLTDYPYLQNSTYRLTLGGDLRWRDAWFGHAAGFGNRLVVNGRPIANGTRAFYDPDTCPGTGSRSSTALSGVGARKPDVRSSLTR